MFSTITTKYPATCKRCHCDIAIGSKVRYGGPGRVYHLTKDCNQPAQSQDRPTIEVMAERSVSGNRTQQRVAREYLDDFESGRPMDSEDF